MAFSSCFLLGHLLDFDKPGFNQEIVRRLRDRDAICGDGMDRLNYQPEEMKLLLEDVGAAFGVNVCGLRVRDRQGPRLPLPADDRKSKGMTR